MQVIYVEDDFNSDEAEGVRLTEELTVGKQIAGGSQVTQRVLLHVRAKKNFNVVFVSTYTHM